MCSNVEDERATRNLWVIGDPGSGKSALCAYIAQRLYSTDYAIAQRVGDLLSHLRWLGGVKGELAVERRLEKLIETPLLVLDNIDRAVRSRSGVAPYALQSSCASHDLIRIARLLRERQASMRPTVVTSRAAPHDCAVRLASVSRVDLVRGLLGTASGATDPFEDFPGYTQGVLDGAFEDLRNSAKICSMDLPQRLAMAA